MRRISGRLTKGLHGEGDMGKPKPRSTPISKGKRRSAWSHLIVPGLLGLALFVALAAWFLVPRHSPVSDAAEYRGGPRLTVDKDIIDFGNVSFERAVKARFRLRRDSPSNK